MAQTLTRIRLAIRAIADAAGGTLQVGLGTPGSYIDYPDLGVGYEYLPKERTATGGAWVSPSAEETTLSGIGTEIDNIGSIRARILTNATLVAPTISSAFGIVSVSKNEPGNYLDLVFTVAYLNAYFCYWATIIGLHAVPILTNADATGFRVVFEDSTGATLSINNRDVVVMCMGQM